MMEEFLELQENIEKLKKQLAQKEREIEEKNLKIQDYTEKINQLTIDAVKNASDTKHFRSMVSLLEADKKSHERERERLLKENESINKQLQQFANMIETLNQNTQVKEESLLSKEKQLRDKDLVLIEKENKIEELRTRLSEITEEKETYQNEKFEFIEKNSKEKLELVEKNGELEKEIQNLDQKLKKTKEKAKTAQNGLLGASMEIEQLNEKLAKLNQELSELEDSKEKIELLQLELEKTKNSAKIKKGDKEKADYENIEVQKYKQTIAELEFKIKEYEKSSSDGEKEQSPVDIFEQDTGIYTNVSMMMTHFKYKIASVQRSLRIILPDAMDIEKFGLDEVFENLPKNILKNIACHIMTKRDTKIIKTLQEQHFKITNFADSNLFALVIDNSEAGLAIYDKKNEILKGFFSNDAGLTLMLVQAIMLPFIKGKKLT